VPGLPIAPEDVHALDVRGLLDAAVPFFGCRSDQELLAVGAIKQFSQDHAELKSMHTLASSCRRVRRKRARASGPAGHSVPSAPARTACS